MTEADDRSFVTSSWLFARALGVVLFVAFVSLGVQSTALFGSEGIAPIASFVESAKAAGHHVLQHPTLFWWFGGDASITTVWLLGTAAAVAVVIGVLPGPALLVAWFSYLSFVSVGWPFMSFQWDTLLLETSFTAMFLVPWTVVDRPGDHQPPNPVARFALWWLLFRLVFRSGYVKLTGGDPTWTDLTALEYHYWTQPLPTALGWYAHALPSWFQKVSCGAMFVVELGAPFLIWIPRAWARRAAALAIAVLMLLIALTGNYGFFNLLTIVLCIPLLDDRVLAHAPGLRFSKTAPKERRPSWSRAALGPTVILALTSILFFAGTFGGGPPRSLGPLYPFATFSNYGLFTRMTTERYEIELEGTRDGEQWLPYEFKYKPGAPDRAPRFVAPHQPRLDWQMWFAALSEYRRNAWLANVMRRLLEGDPGVLGLLEGDPFEDEPPKQVRAIIYRYRPTTPAVLRETGDWWKRDERALYAPILGVPLSSAEAAD